MFILPSAGVTIKLKAEDLTDPTNLLKQKLLQLLEMESLVFDFANQASGTAQIDFSYTYDMLSIFYDFGNAGAGDIII